MEINMYNEIMKKLDLKCTRYNFKIKVLDLKSTSVQIRYNYSDYYPEISTELKEIFKAAKISIKEFPDDTLDNITVGQNYLEQYTNTYPIHICIDKKISKKLREKIAKAIICDLEKIVQY